MSLIAVISHCVNRLRARKEEPLASSYPSRPPGCLMKMKNVLLSSSPLPSGVWRPRRCVRETSATQDHGAKGHRRAGCIRYPCFHWHVWDPFVCSESPFVHNGEPREIINSQDCHLPPQGFLCVCVCCRCSCVECHRLLWLIMLPFNRLSQCTVAMQWRVCQGAGRVRWSTTSIPEQSHCFPACVAKPPRRSPLALSSNLP